MSCAQCKGSGIRVLAVGSDEANPIGTMSENGWRQLQAGYAGSSQAPAVLRTNGPMQGPPMRIELCPCVRDALRRFIP